MRYFVFILSLFISPLSAAQDLVEFENGQVANADDINANFQALKGSINSILDSNAVTDLYGNVVIESDCTADASALAASLDSHKTTSKLFIRVIGTCDVGNTVIRHQQIDFWGTQAGEIGCSTSAKITGSFDLRSSSIRFNCVDIGSVAAVDSWVYMGGVKSPSINATQSSIYIETDELWPIEAMNLFAYQSELFVDGFTFDAFQADLRLYLQSRAFLSLSAFSSSTITLDDASSLICRYCSGVINELSVGSRGFARFIGSIYGGANNLRIENASIAPAASLDYEENRVEIINVDYPETPEITTLSHSDGE